MKFTCKTCSGEFFGTRSSNPTYCSMKCRDDDPKWHAARLKKVAAAQAARPNGLEQLGYALLDALGVTYVRQKRLLTYTVDAYIPALDAVIEFDGDYWHGNRLVHPNLSAKQLEARARDMRKNRRLRSEGHVLVRLWESDIKRHPDRCLLKLRRSLQLG